MKKLLIYIAFVVALVPYAFAQQTPQKKAFTVVIDAGHGGKDAGAVGKGGTLEKNLNLDVAMRLGKKIKENYTDVKVVYTRTTDVFLTLQQRADIVNKNHADLFVCIHTNAAENRSAAGAEVFVLGIDKQDSNLEVAMRENKAMLLEANYESTYEGFDPESVESYIIFTLAQDQYIDQSLQFATMVQTNFVEQLHRADRGVRQAGFWVLHKAAAPSVLVEMGFVSNLDEEKYLASEKGKTEITTAIYDAFVAYKISKERRPVLDETSAIPQADLAEEKKYTKNTTAPKSDKKTKVVKEKIEKQEVKAESSKAVPVAKVEEVKKPEPCPEEQPLATPEEPAKPVYRVQIFSTTKEVPKNDATFRGLKGCKYTIDGKYYKYTYGEDTDYNTMVDIMNELRAKFKDCFVVAFLNGKQIPVKEARAMK